MTFSPAEAFTSNRASDGGFYFPETIPKFSEKEIKQLLDKPFSSCVAEVLNIFTNAGMAGWDIDFSIGRHPVRLENLGHKTIIAECWHNPDWDISRFVQSITDRVCRNHTPGYWAEIAVRAAFCFGIFSMLKEEKTLKYTDRIDVSLCSGDLSALVGLFIAKEMGLPVGNIVCCCNENSSMWELIYHGQLHTDNICVTTSLPDTDAVIPLFLEYLIAISDNQQDVLTYAQCCMEGNVFIPDDKTWKKMRSGLSVSVIGEERMKETVFGVYRANAYLLSPYTAIAYAGSADYRVKSRENNYCIVLAERGAERDAESVAEVLNVSKAELEQILHKR